MVGVGARLGHDIDHSAQRPAILRVIVGVDLKLLDGIDDRWNGVGVIPGRIIIHAIDEINRGPVAGAVDRGEGIAAREDSDGIAGAAVLPCTDRRHSGSQGQQLREIASIQWQIVDCLLTNDRA